MARNSGNRWAVAALSATLLMAGGVRVSAQKAPPAPPTKVKQFPKPTTKPPVPKIIRLAPGQKVITPEQLRKAPTVYAANQRGVGQVPKSQVRPVQVRIPGAPQVLREYSPPAKTAAPAKSVPKKPISKPARRK